MTEPLSRPVRSSSQAGTARPAEDRVTVDPLPYPGASSDRGKEPDRESPPSTPRWVKAFGIIAVVLLLLFAGLHLTGNGPTHMPGASGAEHGMQAP
jgi:hypothetical protein